MQLNKVSIEQLPSRMTEVLVAVVVAIAVGTVTMSMMCLPGLVLIAIRQPSVGVA